MQRMRVSESEAIGDVGVRPFSFPFAAHALGYETVPPPPAYKNKKEEQLLIFETRNSVITWLWLSCGLWFSHDHTAPSPSQARAPTGRRVPTSRAARTRCTAQGRAPTLRRR